MSTYDPNVWRPVVERRCPKCGREVDEPYCSYDGDVVPVERTILVPRDDRETGS